MDISGTEKTTPPSAKAADTDLLISADVQHKLLYEFNDTGYDFKTDKVLHELFEAQVEMTPEFVAVQYETVPNLSGIEQRR